MARRNGLLSAWPEMLALAVIAACLVAIALPAISRLFATRQESLCLANVKTVAAALRLYLTDYDYTLPPRERNPEVLSYFNTRPGGAGTDQWNPSGSPFCHRASQANPNLRWPVVLASYLPDREVWRCPNARLEGGAFFISPASAWLDNLKRHQGEWGLRSDPWLCPIPSFPSGWGGDVTDSLVQARTPAAVSGKGKRASPGLFLQSIGVNAGSAAGMSLHEVPDPSWFVICGDAGATVDSYTTGTLAYPDLCHLECASSDDWQANWRDCPWSKSCGGTEELKTNPKLRRHYARHFGGVNIGFLDGHARWFDSETVIAESPSTANPNRGRLRGYQPGAPTADALGPNSATLAMY